MAGEAIYAHAPFGGGGTGGNAPGHGQPGYGGSLGGGATAFQSGCGPNVGAGARRGATGHPFGHGGAGGGASARAAGNGPFGQGGGPMGAPHHSLAAMHPTLALQPREEPQGTRLVIYEHDVCHITRGLMDGKGQAYFLPNASIEFMITRSLSTFLYDE